MSDLLLPVLALAVVLYMIVWRTWRVATYWQDHERLALRLLSLFFRGLSVLLILLYLLLLGVALGLVPITAIS